jgi:hypothetical protein
MCGALPLCAAAHRPSWTPAHDVDVFEGRFPSDAAKSEALDALDTYAQTGGAKPLLLHFHGGLVSADVARRSADTINDRRPWADAAPTIDAPTVGDVTYGMYFIWHSGLFNFVNRPHFRADDYNCHSADFRADRSILGRSRDINFFTDKRIAARTGHGYENGLEQFIRAYHPLSLPERWCGMKWSVDRAFQGDEGAGNQFIAKLATVLRRVPKAHNVVMVAQSAGAIYVMDFLEALDAYATKNPQFRPYLAKRFDVVLTAPAITFQRFSEKWPHAEPFVANLRIFALTNAREYTDGLTDPAFGPLHLVAPYYRHSLLYFVSGALEPVPDTPLLGMQRYWCSPVYQVGGGVVASVAAQLEQGRFGDYLVWSPTGVPRRGLNASARSHGMFSDDVMTWDSILSIINDGFGPVSPVPSPADRCIYYDDHNYDGI